MNRRSSLCRWSIGLKRLARRHLSPTISCGAFLIDAVDRCKWRFGKTFVLTQSGYNFKLVAQKDDDPSVPTAIDADTDKTGWISNNAWLGLPISIAADLAAIVELVADIEVAKQSYGQGELTAAFAEDFKNRGVPIEEKILQKNFAREGGIALAGNDPTDSPTGTVFAHIWKAVCMGGPGKVEWNSLLPQTTLTVLYQSVFKCGPVHPYLRKIYAEMLQLLPVALDLSVVRPGSHASAVPAESPLMSCLFFRYTSTHTEESTDCSANVPAIGPRAIGPGQ